MRKRIGPRSVDSSTGNGNGGPTRRILTRFRLALVALVAVPTVAVIVGMTGSASAASSFASCTTPYWYWGTRQCTTDAVATNSVSHSVKVTIYGCSGINYEVYDAANGFVVRRGTVPDGTRNSGFSFRINGLYGTYKGHIWDTCAHDRIEVSGW